jgi:hypothetical protein
VYELAFNIITLSISLSILYVIFVSLMFEFVSNSKSKRIRVGSKPDDHITSHSS